MGPKAAKSKPAAAPAADSMAAKKKPDPTIALLDQILDRVSSAGPLQTQISDMRASTARIGDDLSELKLRLTALEKAVDELRGQA